MSDASPLPLPSTPWKLVEQRARLTPDGPMSIDESGRTLDFRAFRDAVASTAAGLAQLGIGPESRVSWQLPTGLEASVLMFALSRLGAIQNPIIPILRRREVEFIIRQTDTELLIVPGVRRAYDHVEMARQISLDVGCRVLVLDDMDPDANPFRLKLPMGEIDRLPPAPAGIDDPARAPVRWIYYTSGTTADPKGALHTDPSILAASNSFAESGWYGPKDTVVVPIPMAHVGGMMLTTLQLRAGCRMALVEAFDPSATPRFASEVEATIISGTVAVFHAYIAAQRELGSTPLLPHLRIAGNGGASRPFEIHAEVRDCLGGAGTMSGWGLTECPAPTAGCVGDTDDQLARTEGRPGPDVEISVVDNEGRDCPPGIEGELRLRAPQLFRGYVDSSLDAQAFDDKGRFRSGDLGIQEQTGHVRVTGRIKDIIIRNGENISALEVEQALASHPKIQDVAVIGLPDAKTGERCCAIVQPLDPSAMPSLSELGAHCRSLGLAKQKVPEQVEMADMIPRNDLGKIDKRSLRANLDPSRESSDPTQNGGNLVT
jgi:acyl-CoA synthetase (AMP-forming)/AMP-acid ligase II